MKSRFESAAWFAAMARLVEGRDSDAAAGALAEAIDVAVRHEGTCVLVFHRDAPPEVLHHTHLTDEMDFLVDVSPRSTLALVVGRRTRRFSKVELARLRMLEPLVHAAMRTIWERSSAGGRRQEAGGSLHQRLTRCFENFGEGLLTERERQITQLLLRGHSTKSVARELGIAPGTVMVHKRNLFVKLGITSQYELFSQFIDAL